MSRPLVIGAFLVASAWLAVLAAHDGGALLLGVDEPVAQWAATHRTTALDATMRIFSRLGSNVLVFSVAAVLVGLAARRCRSLAITLAVAVAARPALEYLVKDRIARPRPDIDRLVDGTGFSHPSGHVLAAVALWGLLPPLVALVTHRRSWWWASVVAGGVLIVGVSLSRVYLGVHWPSDIVQGWLLGTLYLVGLEALFEHHRHRHCAVAAALTFPRPD
ncbi:MAG: phosphatase PAP2 family protein [Actinobacteria bacterium]|nr:phosphatase PAP2 family protein [Actinomycetota bacterium]